MKKKIQLYVNYYRYDGIFGYASEKAFEDVVFFKHSSNFSISAWKEIKQSMKYVKGISRVFNVDINQTYKDYKPLYEKFSKTDAAYKERDMFIHCNKFETFFMAGNRISFIKLFIDLKELLECPIEDNFRKGCNLDYVQFYAFQSKRKLDGIHILGNYADDMNRYDLPELSFFDENLAEERKRNARFDI